MRWARLGLLLLPVSCGAPAGQMVSAQSPPGTGAVNDNAMPQPRNSLPPGAATSGSGTGETQPSYLQRTFRLSL